MGAKGIKQVRESAAVSDCTKFSCVRKVGETRIRKLSAYEIFWIYSILAKHGAVHDGKFDMLHDIACRPGHPIGPFAISHLGWSTPLDHLHN